MSYIKKEFGKKLKFYREKAHLTQEKMAELLNMNNCTLSMIERGLNFITAETLEKMCETLKISPKQLFDFEYMETQNTEETVQNLIKSNPDKINEIYKILNGFLS
ncbi:helix-turn-helix transcriptional regulator [bacterium]|nr:helix-turn-helix transcriptional regulator [bacterium]